MNYDLSLDIKTYCEYTDTSLETFSKETDVSLSLLSKIVNYKTDAKSETLEKIYSFFYKKKFFINKYKIQCYQKNHNVVLFHGAKNEIEGNISLNYSRKAVDFGVGFYAGETYEQSLDFVSQRENGSVYVLNVDYSCLKIKKIDISLEWMLMIAFNRNLLEAYKNTKQYEKINNELNSYDVIIAPIADNRMFSTIDDFVNGGISSESAINAIKALDLGNQIVFKTKEAISHITILDRLYLCNQEKSDAQKKRIELVNSTESYTKSQLLKHAREGLYINEVFKDEID